MVLTISLSKSVLKSATPSPLFNVSSKQINSQQDFPTVNDLQFLNEESTIILNELITILNKKK